MPAVYVSALIPAPVERVWEIVRDFNGLPGWHPLVVESRIEAAQPADQIGCVRNFRLQDGGVFRERLLGLCDRSHMCRYSIIEGPLPVTGYVASMRLLPVTDGAQCFVEWRADFNCPESERERLIKSIGSDVFDGGLRGLQQQFGSV